METQPPLGGSCSGWRVSLCQGPELTFPALWEARELVRVTEKGEPGTVCSHLKPVTPQVSGVYGRLVYGLPG